MKVTIIPRDELVIVDGVGYTGLDLSFIDSSVHAVQWEDNDGHVEVMDNDGNIIENTALTSLGSYQQAVDAWTVADNEATQAVEETNEPDVRQQIINATQQRLNDFAKTRGYFDILTACSYTSSTDTAYKAEGDRCVSLRDQTWDALYAIFGDVDNGTRPELTGYSDIENELPALTWE